MNEDQALIIARAAANRIAAELGAAAAKRIMNQATNELPAAGGSSASQFDDRWAQR